MADSAIVQQIVQALGPVNTAGNGLLGLTTQAPRPGHVAAVAAAYPSIKHAVSSPQKLMELIDSVHARESRNQPGTPADLWVANKAQEALKGLYGINDYTPRGFLKWSETQKQWYDPRQGSGGDSESGGL